MKDMMRPETKSGLTHCANRSDRKCHASHPYIYRCAFLYSGVKKKDNKKKKKKELNEKRQA